VTFTRWFAWRPVRTLGGHCAWLRYVERAWNADLNWWGDASGYAGTDGGYEYRLPIHTKSM
jgi:hypothetical protein